MRRTVYENKYNDKVRTILIKNDYYKIQKYVNVKFINCAMPEPNEYVQFDDLDVEIFKKQDGNIDFGLVVYSWQRIVKDHKNSPNQQSNNNEPNITDDSLPF